MTYRSLRRWVAGTAAVTALLAGCANEVPITPRPSAVWVPHPARVQAERPDWTVADLKERYTVSPNRNPDGLGVLPTLWQQSRMTLMHWPMQRELERLNRIAYARSEAAQAEVLAKQKAYYDAHLVFHGLFLGDRAAPLDPAWYQPEGVYLLDDQGRRYEPAAVDPGVTESSSGSLRISGGRVLPGTRSIYYADAVVPLEQHVARPILVFPRDALRPDTRALTLFLAAAQRRMSFTWVFDPDYQPQFQQAGPELGQGLNRSFRTGGP